MRRHVTHMLIGVLHSNILYLMILQDQYVYIHECLRDFITMDEDEDDEDLDERM